MAAPAATGPAHVAVVSFLLRRPLPPAASGSPWLAVLRLRAWPSGRRPARLRCERGRHARDGGDHRAGAPRRSADPGAERPDPRPSSRAWSRLLAAALRLRHRSPAPQRGHDGFLHLGDRRRAGRLRRHLRRGRAAGRDRGRHCGRPGAHAGRTARLGGLRKHGAGAGLSARAARMGGAQGRRQRPGASPPAGRAPPPPRPSARRFDPRAVAAAALIAFVLLLSSTAWALLAAVLAGSRWRGCSPAPNATPSRPGSSSPPCWPARRSRSPSAAGWVSTPHCGAPAARRCSCRGHLAARGGPCGRAA